MKQMPRLDVNSQLSLAPWNNVTVVRLLRDSNFLNYIESDTGNKYCPDVIADKSEKAFISLRCTLLLYYPLELLQHCQALVNSERNMAIMVRTCCCGCDLRTGILLIGIFGLVGVVASPFMPIKLQNVLHLRPSATDLQTTA